MSKKPFIVWFTGLSGAGKSTLAQSLSDRLRALGKKTYILDGDVLREGLNSNLGFSETDRAENIRRAGEAAYLLADAGVIVLAAFISPHTLGRERARQASKRYPFFEVYLSTSLDVCEARDPKSLYKKARAGLIPDFTGIGSPYESPQNPDLSIDTNEYDVEASLALVLKHLEQVL